MRTTLRILQIAVALLTCPMIGLGIALSLSGGGDTFGQVIGPRLTAVSFFAPILLLLISEAIHRWLKLTPLSLVLLLILLVVWGWMVVRVQQETGFFTP